MLGKKKNRKEKNRNKAYGYRILTEESNLLENLNFGNLKFIV